MLLGIVLIGAGVQGSDVAFSQQSTGTALPAPLFTVIDLHPNGFYSSKALGVFGGHQVGYGYGSITGKSHALLWRGSAASVLDLHPTDYASSGANGIANGQQVGWGVPVRDEVKGDLGSPFREVFRRGDIRDGPTHALLWRGNAGSVVDLHVRGFASSEAFGTNGQEQVGRALTIGGNLSIGPYHALMWHGSVSSVVDLHPSGYVGSSEAVAIAGDQQVGSGRIAVHNGRVHALLWHRSPGSTVDMHPGGWVESWFYGTSGDQQVGYGSRATNCIGPPAHSALMWRSNASSIVELGGGYLPTVAATAGGEQVGDDGSWPQVHAVMWRGSKDSVVDLHAFLPPGFVSSTATGIDSNGDVVGYAVLPANLYDPYGPTHAILWKRNAKLAPIPSVGKVSAPPSLSAVKPLFISSDDRVAFILTDPLKRRTGNDPTNSASYREIPQAAYRVETCERDQWTILDMETRMPGRHTLEVFGDGKFTVYVSTWSLSGHWLTRILDGTSVPGASARFTFPGEVTPFAAFVATLKVNSDSNAFMVDGSLTLSPDEQITPTTQDVMIQVAGRFWATIPAGSFRQIGSESVFKGVIKGVAIAATLIPVGAGRFVFKVEGAPTPQSESRQAASVFGFEWTETDAPGAPLLVALAIGNSAGITFVAPELLR